VKILVVSESIWSEGVVYDIHLIAEGLSAKGHSVFALDPGTTLEFADKSGPISRVNKSLGFVTLVSPRILRISFNRFSLRNFSRLLNFFVNNWIRKKYLEYAISFSKCDLILLYSGVRLGPTTVRLAKKRNIPVVFRNVDKLYNLFPSLPLQLYAIYREYCTYRYVKTGLALTPNYLNYLVELGLNRSNSKVVPFPINTDEFSARTDPHRLIDQQTREFLEGELSGPTLVFVGTFYEFGGLLELVDACGKLYSSGQRFKLILVGDGPIRDKIQEKVSDMKLESIIHITGYQPFELMPCYISLANVCLNVFPNSPRTNDIFSAKIIQYLSCSKPVVSSSLPGIKSALPADATGIVYEDFIEGVLSKSLELSIDIAECKMLGKRGRDYILQHHSTSVVISDVENSLFSTLRKE